MRIVDALIEVLKTNASLTYKEAYQEIVKRNLYQFGAKDPESAVNAKLRCHCVDLEFPGASPVKYFRIVGKKGTRNLYALVLNDDKNDKGVFSETKKRKSDIDDDSLPEEKIDIAYLTYKVKLRKQILDRIIACHPAFFEKLVVDLLLEMGYGSDELGGRVLGKSHDGGIDGVIYEDNLGLSKIYIQAKRNEKGKVGRPVIQSFVGAMQDVQKGVFITTSSFTNEVIEYAHSQQQKSLKLIDGDLLADLMIKYGIGLEKIQTYSIYKINDDFFE